MNQEKINKNTAQRTISLQLQRSSIYPCSYLPDRNAQSEIALPNEDINAEVYSQLMRQGFRRSGLITYRPACAACRACLSIRIPVPQFTPNRSQKRSRQTHQDLRGEERPLRFDEAHYQLYQRYLTARHGEIVGSETTSDREDYARAFLQSSVDTRLIEFRENGKLRMVSLIDVLDDGLSAVYTFFDPDLPGASLGTYGVLWQIEQCAAQHLPYLYLGYWIHECRKMAYKAQFKAHEALIDGVWQRFS